MPNETTNPQTYLKYRWKPQHRYFTQQARLYRGIHVGVTLFILATTLGTLLISSQDLALQMTLFSLALVAIALHMLYDTKHIAQRYRRVAEALQREREMMEAEVGVYQQASKASEKFVRRCEAIIQTQGDAYALPMFDDTSTSPPSQPTDNPFGGQTSTSKSRPSSERGSLSSRFAALRNDSDDDNDTREDRSPRSPFGGRSSSSNSPFSGRSARSSFGTRSSSSSDDNPFGGRSSDTKNPFDNRSSSSSSSRFSGKRPIGSSGGLRQEDNDDPALAGLERGNSRTGVRFAAYYPKEIPVDSWQPVKAYAMLGYAQDAVAADAEGGDVAKLPNILYDRNRNPRYRIPEGAQVSVIPYMDGFQFNPSVGSIGFYRTWHRFDFEVRAVDARLDEATNGYLTFLVDGLIVADVPLSIYVAGHLKSDYKPGIRRVFRKPYRAVYASFADANRQLAGRFQRVYDALGMYTLRDVMEMRAGGDWSNDLLRYVDEAEVFQLFWSNAAAESEVVTQEIERAVARSAEVENFIRPTVWDQTTTELPAAIKNVKLAYLPDIAE
jgi:hypothetical protein